MKVGSCYTHDFTGRIVLVVRPCYTHTDRLGGPLYDCLVLDCPVDKIEPGSILKLMNSQPYTLFDG